MTPNHTLGTGQADMDAEHKVQIGLILALEQSLQRGRGRGDITDILSQLVEYTNIHFMSEQLLMRLHAYPDIGAHEMEHDHLIEQLRRVEDGVGASDSEMTVTEIGMLKRLVIDHIKTHDHVFSQYLTGTDDVPARLP
ncbi:hemerythrin family protein [Telmatospirillum sp.]|uniref:bacteriohemerythrin n=1 Tax=Telmatospirillum sp. TaxID=2079197 RepID=UPI002842A7C3|nr:hemerythrin family protein [Telmatospirillum sp.]MDR3439659.1 hemerythrin family protein [Telmatospirillum sp.]